MDECIQTLHRGISGGKGLMKYLTNNTEEEVLDEGCADEPVAILKLMTPETPMSTCNVVQFKHAWCSSGEVILEGSGAVRKPNRNDQNLPVARIAIDNPDGAHENWKVLTKKGKGRGNSSRRGASKRRRGRGSGKTRRADAKTGEGNRDILSAFGFTIRRWTEGNGKPKIYGLPWPPRPIVSDSPTEKTGTETETAAGRSRGRGKRRGRGGNGERPKSQIKATSRSGKFDTAKKYLPISPHIPAAINLPCVEDGPGNLIGETTGGNVAARKSPVLSVSMGKGEARMQTPTCLTPPPERLMVDVLHSAIIDGQKGLDGDLNMEQDEFAPEA